MQRTQARKVEDLKVGDAIILEDEDQQYTTLVTYVAPEDPSDPDPLDFVMVVLVMNPIEEVVEISMTAMGNQRVEVIA